jgi:hypothetical protein
MDVVIMERDNFCQALWLTPVTLTTPRQRSRKIVVPRQLGKLFERPYLEKKNHKKRAGGVTQGVGPEFKPQDHKKR